MSQGFQHQHSAGGVVVKLDDKRTYVLLIKPHGRNRWQLPKGAIDPGETPRSAALREVREEGGVTADALDALHPIKFFYQMNGKKYVKTVDFFLMKYRSGSALDHDKEVDEARWFPLEQAVKTLTFESEKDVVSQAILALQHQSPQPEGSVAS
jgi:8-oxo-dGTP diphosphatase